MPCIFLAATVLMFVIRLLAEGLRMAGFVKAADAIISVVGTGKEAPAAAAVADSGGGDSAECAGGS